MSVKKILFTAPLDFSDELLSEICSDESVVYMPRASKKEIEKIKFNEEIAGWVCSPCPEYFIDIKLIEPLKNLEIIATPSTGTNHIDLDYVTERDIKVFSLRDAAVVKNIKASSEFTFTLILSSIRNLNGAMKNASMGNWREVEDELRGREINSLSIGIIGYGRIGSNVSKYSNAFGMSVFAYDPYVSNFDEWVTVCTSLEQLVSEVDIVLPSVHLNDETRLMMNNDIFSLMKNGSYFINTSRGDIVDENALIDHLESGRIKSAALDVMSNELEKLKMNKRVLEYARSNDNLIITPHIAGLTLESETIAQKAAYQAVKSIIKK